MSQINHCSTVITSLCLMAIPLTGQNNPNLPKLINITAKAGITFVHNMGDDEMSNLVESNGAGCAFFDYDNDGDLDIYLVNGAYTEGISHVKGRKNKGRLSNALYRNNGDGTFSDVTQRAGVGDRGLGMAVLTADYDNDGDKDLLVTNWGPNIFYRNNGDGTFTDITETAGLQNNRFGIGCTFLDYDKDGFLDLYIGNYIEYDASYQYYYAAEKFPGPMAYHGQPDVLYHNNGNGTFTEVTQQAGVNNPEGRAMGVTSCDIDDDNDWDIFVANDAMENYLYRNNGNGTFTNIARETGTAFGQSGNATSAMSGEFGDIDRDGLVDIIVPDMAYSCIYRNTGLGYFEELSSQMGLAVACGQYTSWSGNFFDFNHDGYGDLLITNGHPHRLIGEENLLLVNKNGKRFENLSHLLGDDFQEEFVSRGSAVGDIDNDGDMDILILNLNDHPSLLLNEGGNKKNWLMFNLQGTVSNRDAIGSRVRLTSGGISQMRWCISNSGYLSQSDYRLHFGLGNNSKAEEVEILWPSGITQTLRDVQANQIVFVKEPSP
jgi:hypothetical protein